MSKYYEIDPKIADECSKWVQKREALKSIPQNVTDQLNVDPNNIPSTLVLFRERYELIETKVMSNGGEDIALYTFVQAINKDQELKLTVCGTTVIATTHFVPKPEGWSVEEPIEDVEASNGFSMRRMVSQAFLAIFG